MDPLVRIMNNVACLPDTCTIRLGEDLKKSEDFVAVLSSKDGPMVVYYSTDALTLGLAIKLISAAFVGCMNECTQEERDSITGILGDAFVVGKDE